jgi:hypothetical protein
MVAGPMDRALRESLPRMAKGKGSLVNLRRIAKVLRIRLAELFKGLD